ncbi:Phosphoserine transaminase [Metarhizium acridum]|uniref:Phosphoserine transaminase n=1 Tax=Metarhizium acridum TaxID=92637 RepID=UPI001C6ABF53|nr:Phosphoserine transaminase [Metarhizium acridum]
MVFYCGNEVVDGVAFASMPKIIEPKADRLWAKLLWRTSRLASCLPRFLSETMVHFFGAQKILGLAGIARVIVRKSLITHSLWQTLTRTLGCHILLLFLQCEMIAKNNISSFFFFITLMQAYGL